MGTPPFAVPSLEALVAAGHQVAAVFTQPDRPVGRHVSRLQPPPVKVRALELGIPVLQPEKLRDGTALAALQELAPDLIVVAAYGRILPPELLALPPLGCINVHSSLLPRWRGAAPINWAILGGDRETGVTIMYMDEGLDTGDILLQASTPLGLEENAQELTARLAPLGAELLVQAVELLAAGTAPRTPQQEALSCQAPLLSRALSPVDWSWPARAVHDRIRGLVPWPAAMTDILTGRPVKLFRSALLPGTAAAAPGTVVSTSREGIDVAAGDGGVVRILELQEAGKRRMEAGAWLAGHAIRP